MSWLYEEQMALGGSAGHGVHIGPTGLASVIRVAIDELGRKVYQLIEDWELIGSL
jgi:hypothetical protein